MDNTTIIAILIICFFGITSVLIAFKHDVDECIKYSAVYTAMLGAIGSYYFTKESYNKKLSVIESGYKEQIATLKSGYREQIATLKSAERYNSVVNNGSYSGSNYMDKLSWGNPIIIDRWGLNTGELNDEERRRLIEMYFEKLRNEERKDKEEINKEESNKEENNIPQ
jgi:hypothetical protein